MEGTRVRRRPAPNGAGEWRPGGKGPHSDVEVRVAYGLFHAETNAFFLDGVVLTQMGMFKKDDGWLLLLKGTRGKRKLKAWLHAVTWRDALVLAATCLDSAHLNWQTDTPPPKG